MWRVCNKTSFWILVNLSCTAALLVQLASVLEGYISPKETRTHTVERQLVDLGSPVIISICVKPGFNEVALRQAGYRNAYWYFSGSTPFNSSMVGWAGHGSSGRPLDGVAAVLDKVKMHTAKEVIKSVTVVFQSNEREIYEAYLDHLNFPHNCYTVNLSQSVEGDDKKINQLDIEFNNITMPLAVEVHLQGQSLATRRMIKTHSFYSAGERIVLEGHGTWRSYAVQLRANVFVEEDPSQNCRNYPNPAFASYRECDDQYMRDTVATIHPGLVPVWLADDLAQVTSMAAANPEIKKQSVTLADLFEGSKTSDCPLPCTTLHTDTRFITDMINTYMTMITLIFSPTVQVTTSGPPPALHCTALQVTITDFPAPALSSFLSEVGG
jgi:hypothetical protein